MVLVVIIYLFAIVKQTEVVCEKGKTFDTDISLKEQITAEIEGKKISSLVVIKTIVLPEKYAKDDNIDFIKKNLDRTLEYLGDKVKYTITNNKIIVTIEVSKNEIVLLDNIDFSEKGDFPLQINSNTKSSDVISLTIGDNYTDGEFMTYMKTKGYNCK